MPRRASVVLLLLSLFWIEPVAAQAGSQVSAAWTLSVRDGQLTADINRIPLRLVLEELARQVPLRLSVSEEWRDHLLTAHFRALPLHEAVARLLAGFSYGLVYAPAPSGAEKRPTGELLVFERAPSAGDAGSSVASVVASNAGTEPGPSRDLTLDTTPEWTAALAHPTAAVRVEALQRWAEQGAATPLSPLTQALVDPDESVRARAQELVERVLAASAEAGAR